jgi:5-dehydro-2-deoxygluconokinase
LLNWPKNHAVKATVIYHPDDKYALRGQIEATLSTLYRASRASSHEFIVELSPPTNSLITASTLSHIMQRFYEIGIYPDWWQVSSPRDHRSWDSIQRVISEYDKYCRGVMLLGHAGTFEQLPILFNAAKQECCKGFAVSKSIFQTQLEQWFAQKIADEAFIDAVQSRFEQAVKLWEQSKPNSVQSVAKASTM